MKDKKLQVFVSSTYTDLKEERQAAVEAILSAGHIPAGMELFSAGDESQMTVIKRWIDESDIYLLILGGRYGSIESNSGKSYTHLEYEYALEIDKPLFAVVINDQTLEDKVKEKGITVIERENPQKLNDFKNIVLSNLVKFWDDKKDIKLAIHETLSDFSYRKELIGWIRGDNNINTAFLAEEIARLTKENSDLRLQISSTNNHILYSNLTYEQLEKLLKNELINLSGKEVSLFDYLLKHGNIFTKKNHFSDEQKKRLEKLIEFKIIVEKNYSTTYLIANSLIFTDDGHKFYIKALFMTKLNQDNFPNPGQ